MANPNEKQRQKQTISVKMKNNRSDESVPDDMYNEVNAFHKQKDMVRLYGKDDEESGSIYQNP